MNWLVPPVDLIGCAIRHVMVSQARGCLLVPAYFWPLLGSHGGIVQSCLISLEMINAGKKHQTDLLICQSFPEHIGYSKPKCRKNDSLTDVCVVTLVIL